MKKSQGPGGKQHKKMQLMTSELLSLKEMLMKKKSEVSLTN